MLLVYTTCTGMSGSGVRTLGMITTRVRQPMAVLGLRAGMIIVLLCAAVPGTTFLAFAVRRSASTSSGSATASTTLSAFGWFVALAGLLSPLLFSPFALFPLSRRQAGRLLRRQY